MKGFVFFVTPEGTRMKCEKSPKVMSAAKNKSIKTVCPSSIHRLVSLRLLPAPGAELACTASLEPTSQNSLEVWFYEPADIVNKQ